MRWLRPDKYDENQSRAFPRIPKLVVKRDPLTAVSNAALKSKRTSSVTQLLLTLSLYYDIDDMQIAIADEDLTGLGGSMSD